MDADLIPEHGPWPVDLLTAIVQGFVRDHLDGPDRKRAWDAFAHALDQARQHQRADGDPDAMPWDTSTASGPATSITGDGMRMCVNATMRAAYSTATMADPRWQHVTTERLNVLLDREHARITGDRAAIEARTCPYCQEPKRPSAITCGKGKCRQARYRQQHRARTAP